MPADAERPGTRLATLLRRARTTLGYSQDAVIEGSGVSRAAYLRWEAGSVDQPEVAPVMAVCRFLEISPRELAIAIGIGTREEYDLPPQEPPYPEAVVSIGRLLADTNISEAARAALLHAITGAYESWQMAMNASQPDAAPRGKR